MPETHPRERNLIVVLGWLFSKERNLRLFARHYRERGDEVLIETPNVIRALSNAALWEEEVGPLADRIVRSSSPLVLHVFSNAGFWSAAALFLALERRGYPTAVRLRAVILDCAPGFPERPTALFTAHAGASAIIPRLEEQLPKVIVRVLFPMSIAFFYVWHLTSPSSVAFIRDSQRVVRTSLSAKRVLMFRAGRDELIPDRELERFARDARAQSIGVEEHRFPDATHVASAFLHPKEYFERVDSFLDR